MYKKIKAFPYYYCFTCNVFIINLIENECRFMTIFLSACNVWDSKFGWHCPRLPTEVHGPAPKPCIKLSPKSHASATKYRHDQSRLSTGYGIGVLV